MICPIHRLKKTHLILGFRLQRLVFTFSKPKTIGILFLLAFLSSCSVVKRLKKDEYLLTENKIIIDSKKNKNSRVNNIPLQQPNTGIDYFPLNLHVYNLARPNRDSIFEAWLDKGNRRERLTKTLSEKQLNKLKKSALGFNSWLKRIGEAPVILDEDKTERTKSRLRSYFYKRGYLYNEVDFEIKKDSNQRANVIYNVVKNKPSFIDTIKTSIKTPIIDSIYKANKIESFVKEGKQFDEDDLINERKRINSLMRNSGVYYFGQDYVRFEIDTFKSKNTLNTELFIDNRTIRYDNSTATEPFKIYKIKEVNIFTDASNQNRIEGREFKDSTTFDDYNLFSYDKLRYRPKALTDAVYIHKGDIYKYSRFVPKLINAKYFMRDGKLFETKYTYHRQNTETENLKTKFDRVSFR